MRRQSLLFVTLPTISVAFLATCFYSIPSFAQDNNQPLVPSKDPAAIRRYQDAVVHHPEKIGGKFESSPTFVGGQAYSYEHCVNLASWVNNNPRAVKEMSVVQLGNLQNTLDDACQYIYSFYGDSKLRKLTRNDATKTPVSPQQYDKDCIEVEVALDTATHGYHDRLDQVFQALPPALKKEIQPFLAKSGHELPSGASALWLPDEFKP